jgi:HSP20 family molecular chaperone IbpA
MLSSIESIGGILMTEKTKEMEIQDQELVQEETERTRECRCFVPRTDIYEAGDEIILTLDMPGINENAIEITLEKNLLNVKGYAQMDDPDEYALTFAEYEFGDYERSFRISDAIAKDKIEALFKNGVLRLTLPKAEQAKARKIAVKVN